MRVRGLILVVTRCPGARATLEAGLGAGSALEVSVATDGCEVGGTSGEVVRRHVRNDRIMVVISGGEGAVRAGAAVACELFGDVVVVVDACGGLPVDGLQTVVGGPRGAELPFADDGPDDACGTDGGTDGDEDDDRVTLQLGDASAGI
jgi:hypothetical protein